MARIILIRGKAGVGKTTISNLISKKLGLTVIHKDDIYDELAGSVEDHQLRNSICDKVIRNIISNAIQNKTDVIIDSSYHYLNQIKDLKRYTEVNGGELKSILLTCSDKELWKNRFEKRKLSPRPNNLIVDFEVLKKHYKSLHTDSILGELVIDTVHPLEENIRQILHWIDEIV